MSIRRRIELGKEAHMGTLGTETSEAQDPETISATSRPKGRNHRAAMVGLGRIGFFRSSITVSPTRRSARPSDDGGVLRAVRDREGQPPVGQELNPAGSPRPVRPRPATRPEGILSNHAAVHGPPGLVASTELLPGFKETSSSFERPRRGRPACGFCRAWPTGWAFRPATSSPRPRSSVARLPEHAPGYCTISRSTRRAATARPVRPPGAHIDWTASPCCFSSRPGRLQVCPGKDAKRGCGRRSSRRGCHHLQYRRHAAALSDDQLQSTFPPREEPRPTSIKGRATAWPLLQRPIAT